MYFVPVMLRVGGIFLAGWNAILFILWTAVFGVFGAVRLLTYGYSPFLMCLRLLFRRGCTIQPTPQEEEQPLHCNTTASPCTDRRTPTDVHQGGRRGRRPHHAHEERRLGRPGQHAPLAHRHRGRPGLLVEGDAQHAVAVHGSGARLGEERDGR